MQRLQAFWSDESGLVLSAELVFVTSIAAIGMIVGLSAARDGITSELTDVGGAINNYNQGYQVNNIVGHGASLAGSRFLDTTDYCDVGAGAANTDMACITRTVATTNTEATTPPAPSLVP